MGSPTALLINQTETKNHWLRVQLVGTESERDAIGARVDVHADDKVWTNWVVGGDGYLCRNEAALLFGLGSAPQVDSVVVTWPNGKSQTFGSMPANQDILLIENDLQVTVYPTR
jgi:hypothetical protein